MSQKKLEQPKYQWQLKEKRILSLLFWSLFSSPTFAWAANSGPVFCTITINSTDERTVLKETYKNIPGARFIELTELSDPALETEDWFSQACKNLKKQDTYCDVLAISGHFVGEFSGKNFNQSLSYEDLIFHRCKNSCDHILSHPIDVYLFGCNTLGGNNDQRTPEQYMRDLFGHGIGPEQLSEYVSIRTGLVGQSYESMSKKIFDKVPNILGFCGAAPLGNDIKNSLAKYLQANRPASTYANFLKNEKVKRDDLLLKKAVNLTQTINENNSPSLTDCSLHSNARLCSGMALTCKDKTPIDLECELLTTDDPHRKIYTIKKIIDQGKLLSHFQIVLSAMEEIKDYLDDDSESADDKIDIKVILKEIKNNREMKEKIEQIILKVGLSDMIDRLVDLSSLFGWHKPSYFAKKILNGQYPGESTFWAAMYSFSHLKDDSAIQTILKKPETYQQIINKLTDPRPMLRIASLTYLSTLAPQDFYVQKSIAERINDSDGDVVSSAVNYLVTIKPKSPEALAIIKNGLANPKIKPDQKEKLKSLLQ